MPTWWACLEKDSALAIMAAVLSSSSPSFCPLSSRAIRARAKSPTTPDAAPFMPSMLPGPGMCWAKLREALPAVVSPTNKHEKYKHRSCFTILCVLNANGGGAYRKQQELVEDKKTYWYVTIRIMTSGCCVLTEVLPIQRLSASTKKSFKETSVGSLWRLHRCE